MGLIIAIPLPWLVFFTIRRPWQGIFRLILQITLIGWPVAAIRAVCAPGQFSTDRKIEDMYRSRG